MEKASFTKGSSRALVIDDRRTVPLPTKTQNQNMRTRKIKHKNGNRDKCTYTHNKKSRHDVLRGKPYWEETAGAFRLQTITIREGYNVETQMQRLRAQDLCQSAFTTETVVVPFGAGSLRESGGKH